MSLMISVEQNIIDLSKELKTVGQKISDLMHKGRTANYYDDLHNLEDRERDLKFDLAEEVAKTINDIPFS